MKADIPDSAIEWLRRGERGVSSEAIFSHLTGVPIGARWMHPPSDPDDLRRCRLLLAQVPEFAARIGEMAGVSDQWARLVARWDELCALMDEEAPGMRGAAPRTFDLMQYLVYGTRRRSGNP